MSERILTCIACGGMGGAGIGEAFGGYGPIIGMFLGIGLMFWAEFRK